MAFFLYGCGGGPKEENTTVVSKLIQEHIKNNKDRLKLDWVKEIPPAVTAHEVTQNPDFSHECYFYVYGEMTRTQEGIPARVRGLFIVGKRRETGKWEITSGEAPKDVELKPL